MHDNWSSKRHCFISLRCMSERSIRSWLPEGDHIHTRIGERSFTSRSWVAIRTRIETEIALGYSGATANERNSRSSGKKEMECIRMNLMKRIGGNMEKREYFIPPWKLMDGFQRVFFSMLSVIALIGLYDVVAIGIWIMRDLLGWL